MLQTDGRNTYTCRANNKKLNRCWDSATWDLLNALPPKRTLLIHTTLVFLSRIRDYMSALHAGSQLRHRAIFCVLDFLNKCRMWPGDNFNVFACFLAKQHIVFNWKDAFSVVYVSSGNAETLFRWGGKINQLLIAQSLSNAFAKNMKTR